MPSLTRVIHGRVDTVPSSVLWPPIPAIEQIIENSRVRGEEKAWILRMG